MKQRFILLCLIISFASLAAQWSSETTSAVDAVFFDWNRTDRPGGAVIVVQHGDIVYRKGFGMADLEHGIPIRPTTVFYAGSVSKQFVATCIAILAEREKLSLTDDVRKYLPQLPLYDTPIRISHLIHHISGIKDYFMLLNQQNLNYFDHPELEKVLALIFDQDALDFLPGLKYQYSNSGYLLLAEIIKSVTGKTLRQFAKEEIFDVLGMDHSQFLDDVNTLVVNRAWGYRIMDDQSVENRLMRFDLVGSGGLYTSVEDLSIWNDNFTANKLNHGSANLLSTLHQTGLLNDGTDTNYAFALSLTEHNGHKVVGHTGSLGGYRAAYFRYSDDELAIIILSNASNYVPADKVKQVAEILLD